MECNPYFCPAVLGSPQPDDCQFKFLGHKMRYIVRQQLSLRDTGSTTSAYSKANSQVTISRSYYEFFFFLPANLDLERKGQREILPSSMDQVPQRQKSFFGKNSYPLSALASFPRIPSQAPEGARCPSVLVLVTRYFRRGKNNFPSTLNGECLAETPFSVGCLING